jgi:hypothetical protein
MTPIEFMRNYEAVTRAHDLRRTLDLIDADAVYWFSDGGSHVGKGAIERALRGNFDAIEGEDYRISDIAWLVQCPDCAVCVYPVRVVRHRPRQARFGLRARHLSVSAQGRRMGCRP